MNMRVNSAGGPMRLVFGLALAALWLGLAARPAGAQEAGIRIIEEAKDLRVQGQSESVASQARINGIDEETAKLLGEYKALLKELETLRVYNKQLEDLIAEQGREEASIQEQIERVTGIQREVTPLMLRMIDGLEAFVKLDVPFLIDERLERVDTLRDLMDRADVSPGERFRRILEGYQIENDYGRTIEAYRAALETNGQSRTVDYLKIGRIAFIYQTLDGTEAGYWNGGQGRWEVLDDDYSFAVRQGLRIARKQAPPDLLVIPVSAPEAAQ